MASTRANFRVTLAVLAAGHFLAFVDRTMVAGALPLLKRHLALSPVEAGWAIGTVFAIAYGVTALLCASDRIGGRIGTRARMMGGVGLWSVASLGTGFVASVPQLFAMRILLGVGQALFVPAALAWIVNASHARRAPALALFTASSTLGRSAALLLVGAILGLLALVGTTDPGAQTWLLFALSTLPNILLIAAVWAIRFGGEDATSPEGDAGSGFGEWLHRAPYIVATLMPLMLIQAVAGWLPTLFVDERGVSPAQAASWLGAATLIGSPLSQVVGGWLMTRKAVRAVAPTVILAATVVALPVLILVGWASNAAVAVGGVLLLMLALGIASFAALLGFQELIPERRRQADNGVYLALVTMVGLGAGPLLTGALVPAMPGDHPLRLALLATGVLATAVCGLVTWKAQGLYARAAAR